MKDMAEIIFNLLKIAVSYILIMFYGSLDQVSYGVALAFAFTLVYLLFGTEIERGLDSGKKNNTKRQKRVARK